MKHFFAIFVAILIAISAAFGYIKGWNRNHVPYFEVRDTLEAEAKRRGWHMIERSASRQNIRGWSKWIEYVRSGRTEEEVTISEWDAGTGSVMSVAFRDGPRLKYINIMPRHRGDPYGNEVRDLLRNKYPEIDCRIYGEK